jgi:hypothetical protein
MLYTVDDAPPEVADAIREFWPEANWSEAANVSFLESRWNPFAVADTRRPDKPCGAQLYVVNGVSVSAEWSIGIFQINACNIPDDWNPCHLFNVRHNCGTAHQMWSERGWSPWYFSARTLGLL